MTGRTSIERRGHVLVGRGGVGLATRATPPDLWFGGDTGATRAILLRAHPIVADGELRSSRLGRRILHGSGEAQRWWPLSIARVGAAIFVDAAHVTGGLTIPARRDVDTGFGGRLALPGVPGIFRVDLARGLRDGATTWSVVFEP